jgi:hypothetical protein
MPKFLLHIYDRNRPIFDREPEDLPALPAARAEAMRVIRELLETGAWTMDSHYGCFIAIHDESGARLDTVAMWEVTTKLLVRATVSS